MSRGRMLVQLANASNSDKDNEATKPIIHQCSETYKNDTDCFDGNYSDSSGSEYIPPSDFSCESSDSESWLRDIISTFLNDTDDFDTPSFNMNKSGSEDRTNVISPILFKGDQIEMKENDPTASASKGFFYGTFFKTFENKHADEIEIKNISSLPLKSKERRDAVIGLRRKGNFILTQQKHVFKPVRRRRMGLNEETENADYYPCVNCLGYYKKEYLWRHRKNCKSNLETAKPYVKVQHLRKSQTLLATTGLLGNYLSKSRVKQEVFDIMRPDEVSFVAKSDFLICLFGESYLNKHKRKQMHTVVSNKMRELARLKIVLIKSTTITNFIDALLPEMYNHLVTAAKVISGYDPDKKTFQASSLALHMGTTLKFVCDIAKKGIMTKNPLFSNFKEEKLQKICELRDIINCHWCNDISSLANKCLNEKKWEKPKLLPLTEDIKCFNNYVTSLVDEAYEKLINQDQLEHYYKILMECTLTIVVVFNRKRIGEVQFLDIDTYERDFQHVSQEESLNSLTEFERSMSTAFKRVIVFGKGSKPVPILFTKKMQKFIEIIIKIRRTSDIVPKGTKYIFANPGSDRWVTGSSVLRKFATKCGAKSPELLTSTRFRKQIATILQLMNFENTEMDQIAKFMGHTQKTHLEFYRLSEDIYQTAKVAKVLLLLNAGKGREIKGKSLNEVEINEENIFSDEETEEQCEQDLKKQNKEENKQTEEIDLESFHTKEKHSEIHEEETEKCKENESKKSNRMRWQENQKEAVLKYFKQHVKNSIPPKKNECLEFVKQNPNLFVESDWVRIKTFVYNTYRKI